MKIKDVLCVVALVGALPCAAGAQVGLSTKPNYDAIYNADRVNDNKRYDQKGAKGAANAKLEEGKAALAAKNFAAAEAAFTEVVTADPNNVDGQFMLGVTEMSLEKWPGAKEHLEIAVKKNPKHPDPKSRLGVTYAKLGDTAGANAQRADLFKMSGDCKGTCPLAPYISNGIQMIDQALQAGPAVAKP